MLKQKNVAELKDNCLEAMLDMKNASENKLSTTVRTCDVFISYRRDGGDMAAMYFFQALKERGYRVF